MKALGKGSIASWVQIALQIAWWLLWFAAAALVLGAITYGALLALTANGIIDPRVLTNALPVGVDGGTTWPVVAAAFLTGAVAIGGALIIVWRLRKLFESFSSGEPFRRENAHHLRAIWITMLAIELSRYLLLGLTGALLTLFSDPGVEASYTLNIDVSTWGSILILIVLAEVFREGARLKEEQELTI